MSLSKQLYIIFTIIFFIIFTGNFISSVNTSKEYLKTEAQSKAQDAATLLGVSLKKLINNNINDPEIESIINVIANSGFYKEIKLEDIVFKIKKSTLFEKSNFALNNSWKITDVKVNKDIGTIETLKSDNEISKELELLEKDKDSEAYDVQQAIKENQEKIFLFVPSKNFKENIPVNFTFTAKNNNKKIIANSKIKITKTIYSLKRNIQFQDVPNWFINLIPIKLEEKSSEISNNWKTEAKIFVSANPGNAYEKLYTQAKTTLFYTILFFIGSLILLFIFLQYILKPLKNLETSAYKIANGNFTKIENLPWTLELKSLSLSFNNMSSKLEKIIKRLNNDIEKMTKKLGNDELTDLPQKQTFILDLKNILDNHKTTGYISIIKIFNLGRFAKHNSNEITNNYIKDFAKILIKNSENNNLITNYRFIGSEFAMICKNFKEIEMDNLIKNLQKDFIELGKIYNTKDIAHIGTCKFNAYSSENSIISSANEAYEKAKLIGPNESFVNLSKESSRNKAQWQKLISKIIDNTEFQIDYIQNTFMTSDPNKLLSQEAFAKIKDDKEKEIPIAVFISLAEKYEKIIKFDKKIIEKVINHIITQKIKHEIIINISIYSIDNTEFILWLQDKLTIYSKISNQLVFCASAYSVAKNTEKFKLFSKIVHKKNAKTIIKRFESRVIELDTIKILNFDYIRLAKDYTINIHNNPSKQKFVSSVQELANLLNMKIFAEKVTNEKDFNLIKKIGLYGASK